MTHWDRTYEPAPEYTPWLARPLQRAGGLTPAGIFAALLLAFPVVAGGILLAWVVA